MLKASVKHLSWWSLMLAMLLGLAILALRLGLPKVADYRSEIAEYLGESLGVNLDITTLDARWEGYYPALSVGGLRVISAGEQGPEVRLSIETIDVQLDPWRSLLRWQPIFERLELSAADGFWQQRDGQWLHRPGVGADSSGMSERGWRRLLGLILSQPKVGIRDSRLMMIPDVGSARQLESIDAVLENVDSRHQLSGQSRLAGLSEDTRLQFAIQFEGTPEDPLRGDYPFYLKLDSLGPELFNLVDIELPLIRLRAGTEFWGRWHDGALQSLNGALAIGELDYGVAPNRVVLSNSYLDFALLPKSDGYQLQLNNIHLNTEGAELVLPQVLLESAGWQQPFRLQRLAMPELELAALTDWLLHQAALPEAAIALASELQPSGRLQNLVIEWPANGDWRDFELRADADELAVQAYYGAPAASGVSGLLQANISGGAVHLDSDRFDLHFPKLYPQGWAFNRADGIVRWELSPEAALIHSELLHLKDASVSAAGRFSIDIPYDREQQTELTLQIGITDGDATRAQSFTPGHEVGEGLYRWLGDAIQAGHIRQAGLLLHGGTRSLESRQPPVVQLFFDIGQAQLKFDPDWPSIDDADFFLYIHNGDLRVDIRHATLLDTTITSGWAYKPLHDPRLAVIAELDGPAKDLEQVLRSKPLQSVGDALGDWHFDGAMKTGLRLEIPVQTGTGAKLNVVANGRLSDGRLESQAARLSLSQLSGTLAYTSSAGLSSGKLEGKIFDQSISGRIATNKGVTRVDMQGRLPIETAQGWTEIDQLSLMSGTLNYSAALSLCSGQADCASQLEIYSDLQGVAVDLPAPLHLSADQPGELKLHLALDTQQLDFSYRQALKGRFDLTDPSLRGTLHLGEGAAVFRPGAGLYVDGSLVQLDASELMSLLDRLAVAQAQAGSESEGKAVQPLQEVDLWVDRLLVGGNVLNQLHAIVKPGSAGWAVHLEGQEVVGDVRIPDAEQPIEIKLSRLSLGQSQTDDSASDLAVEEGNNSQLLSPASMTAADIEIDKLLFRGRDWGRWKANLRPEGQRLRVQNIDAQLAQFSLKGELNWLGGAHPHTGLTLKIQGRDIGRQLEQWQMDKAIESEALSSDLQLDWPGAPWSISLANLDGAFEFQFKDGRLIESGNSANLLRVFGILNFNTLGRRLKLDFSDLFQKGVAFDRLEGRYRIAKGIASTLDPLVMEGPSANLKATGSLNLIDETVDKEMEVVLPLASNVPFAAVLLGAPQVAGAVFLIDKLIGDKLERVTTLKYHISGDWSEPQVELQTSNAQNRKDSP
ncbi:TIGR02099 family protein [Marinobacterium zhoushanense]|uniref:TIGR02099 family protein n=1 Tax=Marinobacterium zhoushanense TaxID=1679163 RepID=A0ABQ1K4G3_9GAMM|nr:YhdP family protein [Marinobacterium zhoushanense]GGB83687.1 TIGR02099 family protein [Marinobacterium zhoushanense]